MIKNAEKWRKRIVSIVVLLAVILVGNFPTEVNAAGIENLYSGVNNIGGFTFTNVNTTPTKTVEGTSVTFTIKWKKADSDAGIGDVKLTMQILDATTGNALTGKYVFTRDATDTEEYITDSFQVNVANGQKIKIWFDASSVDVSTSNGKYRSISISSLWAIVN